MEEEEEVGEIEARRIWRGWGEGSLHLGREIL